ELSKGIPLSGTPASGTAAWEAASDQALDLAPDPVEAAAGLVQLLDHIARADHPHVAGELDVPVRLVAAADAAHHAHPQAAVVVDALHDRAGTGGAGGGDDAGRGGDRQGGAGLHVEHGRDDAALRRGD